MAISEITTLVRTSPLLPSLSERQMWLTKILPKLNAAQLAQAGEVLRKAQAAEREFAEKRLAGLRQKEKNLKRILTKVGSLTLERAEKTQTVRDTREEDKITEAIAKA